jgi:hypothetical protein
MIEAGLLGITGSALVFVTVVGLLGSILAAWGAGADPRRWSWWRTSVLHAEAGA